MCCNSVVLNSVHMTFMLLFILERDPPLKVSSISWEFFLIRCEILGQGYCICTDCKAHWGKFVSCDIGLYRINWIEIELKCSVNDVLGGFKSHAGEQYRLKPGCFLLHLLSNWTRIWPRHFTSFSFMRSPHQGGGVWWLPGCLWCWFACT